MSTIFNAFPQDFLIGEELWNCTHICPCGYAFDGQRTCVLHLADGYAQPPTFRGIINGKKGQSFPKAVQEYHKILQMSSDFHNYFLPFKEKSPCDFNAPRIAQNSVQEQFQPHSSAGSFRNRSFQNFPYRGRFTQNGNLVRLFSTHHLPFATIRPKPVVKITLAIALRPKAPFAHSIAHRQRFCQVKSQKNSTKSLRNGSRTRPRIIHFANPIIKSLIQQSK